MMRVLRSIMAGMLAAPFLGATPAQAELRLSELVVELRAGKHIREDLEIWNDSPDRAFVAIEPREIIRPGSDSQASHQDPDPERLGILVSPSRLILEPGQRRLLRIAAIAESAERERIFRVTVRPIVGALQSEPSGIKILVGYDVLVLVRPNTANVIVGATRDGRTLTLVNRGNVSVELVEGRQCPSPSHCSDLPGKRLYPGASWTTLLPADGPAQYLLKSPTGAERRTF